MSNSVPVIVSRARTPFTLPSDSSNLVTFARVTATAPAAVAVRRTASA
jgi:hypothetical protein